MSNYIQTILSIDTINLYVTNNGDMFPDVLSHMQLLRIRKFLILLYFNCEHAEFLSQNKPIENKNKL